MRGGWGLNGVRGLLEAVHNIDVFAIDFAANVVMNVAIATALFGHRSRGGMATVLVALIASFNSHEQTVRRVDRCSYSTKPKRNKEYGMYVCYVLQ